MTMMTVWLRQLRNLGSIDENEFSLFDWYLSETEALVTKIESEEAVYVDQQIASGVQEPNNTGLLAASYWARRIRYSHVIHLASMVEGVMKRQCDRLILTLGEQAAPFSPADLKGDQWSVKRKVLERYGHFEITEALWTRTGQLIDVRNVVVHENGDASSLSDSRRRALANLPGIRLVSGEIEVSVVFVRDAFSLVREIAEFLDRHVNEVIDRRLRPIPLD